MADEETVANQQSSWWAPDAGEEPPLPPPSFDEAVDWADAIRWPDSAEPQPVADAIRPLPLEGAAAEEFSGHLDGSDNPFAGDLMLDPLLSGPVDEHDEADFPLELLPESIWAPEEGGLADTGLAETGLSGTGLADSGLAETGLVQVTDGPEPTFYAEADRPAARYRTGRFDPRQAKPATMAVAALVALVLVGVLFSVRHRSDVSSTASQGPANGNIATQAVPRTVVIGTTTTVFGNPAPSIAVNDLLPPGAEPAADTGSGSPVAGGAPAASRPSGPTTTTGAARASSPSASAGQSGGGGGSGTQPSGGTPAPAPAPAAPAPAPDPAPSPPPPAEPTPDPVPSAPTPPRTPRTTPQPDISIPVISVPTMDPTPATPGTPTTRPKTSVPSVPSFPGF
jgi:hypothetical protein